MKHAFKINLFLKSLSTIGVSVSLCACIQLTPPTPNDPHYAPTEPLDYNAPVNQTGSLYWESDSPRYFVDRVAYRVGDILLINID